MAVKSHSRKGSAHVEPRPSLTQRLKVLFIGAAHSPHDRAIFHKLSLIAFFARVGLGAEGIPCLGTDVVDEVAQLGPKLQERFPQAVFFGGRLVFPQDSLVSRWLHNYVIFSVQKTFYYQGIPFFVVPIKM
jgi:hypothetical protein